MRSKLPATVALATIVLLAWVAAPALSLNPYQPGAVDFERSLPEAKKLAGGGDAHERHTGHGEHPQEGPEARWISPPVKAQDSFDLVGVAGEMRRLEIRVRSDGGEWSEWVEQADGTPVYTGGTDEAQVRAPFKPSGELHFVNVSGTAGGFADRLVNSARGTINSAFISVASTPVAQALAPKPKVTSRAGWGADLAEGGCPPRRPPAYGSVSAGVIHHTVNANDYAPEEAASIVLGICRFHVYGNGWDDIGYNALVDRYGVLYEGRAGGLKRPVVGAHAQGFNDQATSIASLGEHGGEPITPQARGSIIRYLAWKLGVNRAVPATGTVSLTSGGGSANKHPAGTVVTLPRVIGHGDLGATSCPGATLAAEIPAIRNAIQKRIKRYAKGPCAKLFRAELKCKRKCARKARDKGKCKRRCSKRFRAKGNCKKRLRQLQRKKQKRAKQRSLARRQR